MTERRADLREATPGKTTSSTLDEDNPLVSVIMPNFNKAEYLRIAITSLLRQTLTNFELIIVDDASNDDSVQVINEFLSQDHRLRILKHGTKEGVSATRNDGIMLARGPLVTFLDSDDIYAPTKLEAQYLLLVKQQQPSVCYCGHYQIDAEGRFIQSYDEEFKS